MGGRITEEELQQWMNERDARRKGELKQKKEVSASSESLKAKASQPRSTMNKTEAQYAEYLELLRRTNKIKMWKFHAVKLYLAETCWYETDFMVVNNDDELEIHETKGFMRDDALVKFKVACAAYPFIFKMVKKIPAKQGGGWDIRDGNGGNVYKGKK